MTHCSHFSLCGGCQYLDLPYPIQLENKFQALKTLFLNLWPHWEEKIQPILPCQETEFFRNKMEFAFSVKGTEENSEYGDVYLGLKKRGSFACIVPISYCYLQSDITNHLLAHTSAFFTQAGLTTWNYHVHRGTLRYLAIRHSKTTNTFMITLIASEWQDSFETWAQDLAQKFPQVGSVLVGINPNRGDTAFCPDTRVLWGTPILEEQLDQFRFQLSPASFFQTNTHQAKVLYRTIAALADIKPTDTVFDLYCGTGTIGLYVSPKAKKVIGIDENPASIENAILNASLNHVHHAEFITQNVKNFLKFTELKADVIIVDPPRDGLIPKALKRIIEKAAPQLIYVSCNPKTLVRDLQLLVEGGYDVQVIQPVDMFPHTGHVETVVKLQKSNHQYQEQ